MRWYIKVRRAVIRIQACARGFAARRLAEAMRRERATIRLQSFQRGRVARRRAKKTKEAVAAVQACFHTRLLQMRLHQAVKGACRLQRWIRSALTGWRKKRKEW